METLPSYYKPIRQFDLTVYVNWSNITAQVFYRIGDGVLHATALETADMGNECDAMQKVKAYLGDRLAF